jgi:rhamnosyltransferase
MNIAGVVILYNPDSNVNENISSYLSFISRLYIIDNSEWNTNSLIDINSFDNPKIFYIKNEVNNGIAKSLNLACRLAQQDGFFWLLTMDQDSKFDRNNITNYFDQIAAYEHTEAVAMFGVQYSGPEFYQTNNHPFQEVNRLITSGSVINLKNIDIIGGFDENLFIDEVDLEFCFRAIIKGFKVILCKRIHLNHNLGIVRTYRSLKNFNSTSRTLHAPVRIYYMVRNHLYVYSKYKTNFSNDLLASRKAILNRLKNNLIYNSSRLKVFKYIIKGIADFRKGKMGKIN